VRPAQLAGRLRQSRQRLQLLLEYDLAQEMPAHHGESQRLRAVDALLPIDYTLAEVPVDAAYFHAQDQQAP